MSRPIAITLPKMRDSDLLKLFSSIAGEEGEKLQFFIGGRVFSYEEINSNYHDAFSHVISDVQYTMSGEKFRVEFKRGITGVSNGSISYGLRIPSQYFDEIHIYPNNESSHNRKVPNVNEIRELTEKIDKFSQFERPEFGVPDPDGLVKILQNMISSYSNLNEKIAEEQIKLRSDIRFQIESEYQERVEKLKREIEKEKSDLRLSQEELSRKQKEIDDRSHMHVRRDLRKSISEDINARMMESTVHQGQMKYYWSVVFLSLIGFAVTAVYSYYNFYALEMEIRGGSAESGGIDAWLSALFALRGLISSFISVGFVVYSISWLRRAYLDNVDAKYSLQKYSLDINRSSWIIETILEIGDKNQTVPDPWIQGVCHGLFKSGGDERREVSPLEAWGTLLNVSGKAEIGPEGPKVQFSGKRLAKGPDD